MDKQLELFLEMIADANNACSLAKVCTSIRDNLGVDHLAYLAIQIPQSGVTEPLPICTYTDDWVTHYKERGFVNLDPVVRASRTSRLPFEWGPLQTSQNMTFFGEAATFGVGSNGLTVPIHGALGEVANINANSTFSTQKWEQHLKHFRHSIIVVGAYFHAAVADVMGQNLKQATPELRPRETECLKWAAAGKTAWETSLILNISEATVNFHLKNACRKLGVYSKHHAVMKSLLLGMLCI